VAVGTWCCDSAMSRTASGARDCGVDPSQISVAIVSYSYGAFVKISGYRRPRSCFPSVCRRKSCFFMAHCCALLSGSLPLQEVESL